MAGDLLSAMVADAKTVAEPIAQAYASGNRPFRVRITRPSVVAEYDRDNHQLVNPADAPIYEGPCRFWPATGGVEIEIGGEELHLSNARASIDPVWVNAAGETVPTTLPRVLDLLEVLENPQSVATSLAERAFVVGDVEVGGHFTIGYVLTLSGVAPSRRT